MKNKDFKDTAIKIVTERVSVKRGTKVDETVQSGLKLSTIERMADKYDDALRTLAN